MTSGGRWHGVASGVQQVADVPGVSVATYREGKGASCPGHASNSLSRHSDHLIHLPCRGRWADHLSG